MSSPTDLALRDGPRDECGVFGIYAPEHDVAASRISPSTRCSTAARSRPASPPPTAAATSSPSARSASSARSSRSTTCGRCSGDLAIGHVRYSTTGSNEWENSQPVHRSAGSGGNRRELALAHNGNLINAVELHAELREQRRRRSARTSDSEIIAALLASHPADDIEDAIADVLPRLKGAFSTVVMTKDRVVAFRDPAGLRPLVLGRSATATASPRSRARFDIIGAELLRDVAARRDGVARRARAAHAPGRRRRARGVLRLRVHLLRAARLAHGRRRRCRPRAAGWARSSPARRRRRRRPRHRRAGLRQRRGPRLRARVAGCRRTTGSSRTATSRGRSSSPARSCASTACG